MDVEIETRDSKSEATIKMPTSMDATNTALLGAALETIDKVGPSNADIRVKEIRDVRVNKRDYIVKRARQLLESMNDQSPDVEQITEDIKREMREKEITEYSGFDAGPAAASSDEVVVVEGKADVINLLQNGVRNAIAVGGTSVPPGLEDAVDGKKVTAFLDGDRGGELILKELQDRELVDSVTKAPEGTEVEELDKKQIHESLRDSDPVRGTRAINVIRDSNIVEKKPLSKLQDLETDSADALVLDGEAGEREVGKAEKMDAEHLVATKQGSSTSSSQLEILTDDDL